MGVNKSRLRPDSSLIDDIFTAKKHDSETVFKAEPASTSQEELRALAERPQTAPEGPPSARYLLPSIVPQKCFRNNSHDTRETWHGLAQDQCWSWGSLWKRSKLGINRWSLEKDGRATCRGARPLPLQRGRDGARTERGRAAYPRRFQKPNSRFWVISDTKVEFY